ncbi:TlpA family protein disulfide reductase [Flavobacterium sp.]|uniref:TlpA family protein disulfide reductase n=1 Tax=Flavobacterium sp. TaxID=239 RepID=UPI0040470DF2
MKKICILFLLVTHGLFAQTIKGSFPQLQKSEILLLGFNGFETKELAKTTTDSLGNFELQYPKAFVGAALLEIKNTASVIILLNQENFGMQWDDVKDFNTLQFSNSPENDAFATGITVNQAAENKLNGLKYLLPQYEKLPKQQQWLQEEIANQEQQFNTYLNQLPKDSYAKQYLKIRKLITDFPQTANRYIERMPEHEKDFNALNFNDEKLYTSGLVKDLLEGYFQLMESHIEPKEMYVHINTSIDAIVKGLATNTTFQQEVAQHLFNYFEKRSLQPAAEHIALQMLNQTNCQLSEKSTNLFEQYRKLAIGKRAPNIIFENKDKRVKNKDLKSINGKYKLVVFGASWCPSCKTEALELLEHYDTWKTKNVEVVYISIDTDKAAFTEAYQNAPWQTYCDYKGWDTKAAKDYYISGTPSYFLLDANNTILLRPNNVNHANAWISQKL